VNLGVKIKNAFVLQPGAKKAFKDYQNKKISELTIIIGAEKGFDNKELKYLIDLGCQPISINQNVLRAETAPIVALSIVNYLWN